MKGLLLKDLYMMKHYCKVYLFVALVFLAVSICDTGNMFFVFYPCLLCGMIPVNLLSYDERSRFLQYSAALPCSKSQIVSAKYLLGLFVQLTVLLATGIVQAVKMSVNGTFALNEFIVMMLSMLIVSSLASSISLPFIFRYGVEKGRVAYYVMVGFVCGISVLFSELFKGGFQHKLSSGLIFAGLSVVGIGIYILSWYLSVEFYKKREL